MYKKFLMPIFVLIFVGQALADVARPDRTPKGVKKPAAVDTYLSIKLDRDAKEATLIIPRSQLKALRAELESIDNGNDSDAATATGGTSRMQTIMSGLFISLAIVFGGVWIARSGKLSTKAVAVGMVVFAGAGLASFVYGNAGPPAEARSITGKMFSPALHVYKFGGGKVKLEISDTEDRIELIVPDAQEPKKADE